MKKLHHFFMTIILIYLFFPLFITFLYSIATDWHQTILPEGFTFKWYIELFQDDRFLQALNRTLGVTFGTMIVSILIMVPTVFIVSVYFSKWERILQTFVMLPYAVPGVVGAVGLIKLYSQPPFLISGTVWILIGAYFVGILPFMYQGIRNSLRTVNAIELVTAAELLGANKVQAFRQVVFPNILPGIIVSSLLSFSMLFGEFVTANLLVGGQFETIQIYLMRRMSESGHLSSAIVISYFLVILFLSWVVLKISQWNQAKSISMNIESIELEEAA